jgi:hypothetical protein
MMSKVILLLVTCFFLPSVCAAESPPPSSAASGAVNGQMSLPLFLANLHNPNDFSLFANGGWDGNWYVGFNTCWIQKVVVPDGNFRRAFLGARLGRMKNFQPQGKAPWEKKAFPGEIYIAVSSTGSWSRAQSYFLTSTEDIPLEPDPENAVEGVGESRWFWTEIPMKLLKQRGEHFIALWSPTEKLNSVSSSPILAAGWGTKDVDSWVDHDVKGMPPADPAKVFSTPVTVFEPAIAMKLVPSEAPSGEPRVKIVKVDDGILRGKQPAPKIVWSAVEGESIERAWIEVSTDTRNWGRYGRYAWNAPYCFTLKMNEVPIGKDGKTWVRVLASDSFENVGASGPVNLFEK